MSDPDNRRTKRHMTALIAAGGCVLTALVAVPVSASAAGDEKAAFEAKCPVAAEISQGYGDGHDGVDLAAPRGTPIFAAGPGEVTESGPASGYGQWVRIKHPDGSVTEYGHMFERFVAVGDSVTAGQRIASVGSEGQSTGPHLHFEVHLDGGTGVGDDPLAYMSERGVALPCTP
jgi:murein DD-endopeptidase MepM/ murein hydrolase activator NlpD